ncbi:MAG: (d)CMP kinase [Rhodobiaceae bacterium]|nr:(d)CMP kinase [Rhodobiaceae bacterium]
MIIAIDGPAASGKGTLARRLAERFGLPHLDTGLLYRAVGRGMLLAGHALDDEETATLIASRLALADLRPDALRGDEIAEAASRVAQMPPVRAALVQLQRRFAATPPGAVIDGRDIGTVICPEAEVKLFVTASPEVRARRRHAELTARGETVTYDDVLADLKRRDARDAGRAVSPLAAAPDAHLLDTSDLDIEAAFRAAVDIVQGDGPVV